MAEVFALARRLPRAFLLIAAPIVLSVLILGMELPPEGAVDSYSCPSIARSSWIRSSAWRAPANLVT